MKIWGDQSNANLELPTLGPQTEGDGGGCFLDTFPSPGGPARPVQPLFPKAFVRPPAALPFQRGEVRKG